MSWTDIPAWALEASKTIMDQVRSRDQETFNHCVRVSRGCRLLAKSAGYGEAEQKVLEFAGLFHDIGKIAIPLEILNKPAKLTKEEYELMKSHPERSVQIMEPLQQVEFFKRLIPGVLYHHERFDGAGYPHGVYGEKIPMEARLILVVDTFDAMTADRAYRKGLPKEVAYKELSDCSGNQFDPRFVEIFLEAHPSWNKRDEKDFEEMNSLVLRTAG